MIESEKDEIRKLLDDIDDHITLIQEDIAYLRDKYDLN